MEELLKNPATTVVDVRETGEFAGGHFEGAINIPLGIVPVKLDEFKAMPGPIVVYCRSGKRSGKAIEIMQEAGFHNLFNLDGGIIDWANAGMPLVSN